MNPEQYTYDQQMGWKNTEGKPVQPDRATEDLPAGTVTEWMTKNGYPLIIPDQWIGKKDWAENMDVAPLPSGIQAMRWIDNKVVTTA